MMKDGELIQNFSGMRALIVADARTDTGPLSATLLKLGLTAASVLQGDNEPWKVLSDLKEHCQLLIIDGDLPVPNLAAGSAAEQPSVPILGLVGVEAPNRLRGLLRLGVTGFLRKPVYGSSVYAALYLTVNEHRRRRALEDSLERHEERKRGRRYVIKAVIRVMQEHGLNDEQAFDMLRRDAMRARKPLEAYCEAWILKRPPLAKPSDPSASSGSVWRPIIVE